MINNTNSRAWDKIACWLVQVSARLPNLSNLRVTNIIVLPRCAKNVSGYNKNVGSDLIVGALFVKRQNRNR